VFAAERHAWDAAVRSGPPADDESVATAARTLLWFYNARTDRARLAALAAWLLVPPARAPLPLGYRARLAAHALEAVCHAPTAAAEALLTAAVDPNGPASCLGPYGVFGGFDRVGD
jgi:hypothetical protein